MKPEEEEEEAAELMELKRQLEDENLSPERKINLLNNTLNSETPVCLFTCLSVCLFYCLSAHLSV